MGRNSTRGRGFSRSFASGLCRPNPGGWPDSIGGRVRTFRTDFGRVSGMFWLRPRSAEQHWGLSEQKTPSFLIWIRTFSRPVYRGRVRPQWSSREGRRPAGKVTRFRLGNRFPDLATAA